MSNLATEDCLPSLDELETIARRQGKLTFVLYQLVNVIIPAEDDFEHVKAKIVWSAFWSKVGRTEGHIAKPSFGERKKIRVFVLLCLLRTSENFLA